VGVILLLTAVNYVGLKEGAGVQSAVTAVKVGSILLLGAAGLSAAAPVVPQLLAPLPEGHLWSAFGVAMIAVMWTFDGWYGVTNVGEEMRRPERDLPIGLIAGTLAVTALYALLNLVYVRALPLPVLAETSRVGESAALALFGPAGARLVVAAVLVSTFGCLSATILYAARIYLPMAQDGVFFPALARIHPRFRTPAACLAAQGAWSAVLTLSGSYEQLYTYTTFAVVGSYAATGGALIVLRRKRPELARPYRVWGYPLVPAAFALASLAFMLNTVVEKPREALAGLLLIVLGLPAYAFWRRRRPLAGAAPAEAGPVA
jgi:APA family basic amino acid/polyamine antiporter